MDIKPYIDYFDEISHLDRSEQFKLLEQANQQIEQNYKFPILSVLPLGLRLFCLAVFCGGSYLLFGHSLWLLAVAAFIGLIVSRVITSEITDSLLRNALLKLT